MHLTSMIFLQNTDDYFVFQKKTFCNITCTFSSCFIKICNKNYRCNIHVSAFIDMFLIACAFLYLSFTQGIREFCKMDSDIDHFSNNIEKVEEK